jgi:hypothetical protein
MRSSGVVLIGYLLAAVVGGLPAVALEEHIHRYKASVLDHFNYYCTEDTIAVRRSW